MQKKINRLYRLKILVIGSLLACTHTMSLAVDSISFELGSGNKSQLARIGAQWNWDSTWWSSNGTHISGYWDASLAQFRQNQYKNIPGQQKYLTDLGFTPVFRFESTDKNGFYAEAGIGVHLMSHLYNNNGRSFSTAFEFGDHIGAGYVFSNGVDLGLRLQHFSNGGIKQPNNGANFALVRVAHKF